MTDIETIAAAIHETWRSLSRAEGWSMQPHLDRPYAKLADNDKEDNRAAARRMGSVLASAGLALSNDPAEPEVPAATLITSLEAMAETEHNGWMDQRARSGWTFGPARDDAAKRHPSMLPYAQLTEHEKEKDRSNIRHYPDFAARAGYRVVRARGEDMRARGEDTRGRGDDTRAR
jgi:RyR domain